MGVSQNFILKHPSGAELMRYLYETVTSIYISSCIAFLTSLKLGILPTNLRFPLIIRVGVSFISASAKDGISAMIWKSSSKPKSVKTASTMGATLLPPQQMLSKIFISINKHSFYFDISFFISSLEGTLPEIFKSPSITRPGVLITP